LDVGDVAAPAGVGCLGGEVLPDQIGGVDRAQTCGSRFLPRSGMTSLQASGAHEAPDSLGGGLDAAHDQFGPDAAYARVAVQLAVDLPDGLGELGVVALPLAGSSGAPPVVALPSHAQLGAHERDR